MDPQHWFLLQETKVSGTALSLLLVVLDDEVFVGEHAAVDGLAALPVAVREIPALHHEVLHHAVEHRPVVVKRLPYMYNN
jgi:hypothetical protein